ncbi:MAG: hypothetical protein K2L02_06955 [Clostridia bacterium]|nr:hypothetical protein [Clostridia bacterium]
MDTNKIEAYLGFALRAGKLVLGLNSIETVKKGVYCLLLDEGAAKNSHKEARKLKEKFACPLIIIKDLGALIKREGCKLAALKDSSLAEAILKEAGDKGISIEGAIG